MEVISLWHCWGGMEAQVLWQWPSGHLHCWVWCLFIFLLTIPDRFSMGFRSGEFAGQSSTVTPWSLKPAFEPKFPGRWLRWLWTQKTQWTNTSRWHGSPIITDCGNFTLDFKQHGFCASPLFLQTLGPWFPNEMQNLLSSEKRTLDHCVLFLHSPGKTLLMLSLIQKWLGSPFPEDVWAWWLLMHWLQLQSTPCEALTSVWISFAWQYSQACSHPCCLCTFPTQILPSSQLCIQYALIQHSVNSHTFQ